MVRGIAHRVLKNPFGRSIAAGLVFLPGLLAAAAPPPGVVTGNVRVQLLSEFLLRIELKGPEGFENRKTFHIVTRDWSGAPFTLKTNSDAVEIRAADYTVRVPKR
ncbi:MAG: hypothetical protein KGJ60_15925 [Verrucomicrobiota bacterium]|nr:hypothetical protein [Verrucomicrobiota bacterium]